MAAVAWRHRGAAAAAVPCGPPVLCLASDREPATTSCGHEVDVSRLARDEREVLVEMLR
jgi:hypothetical protein